MLTRDRAAWTSSYTLSGTSTTPVRSDADRAVPLPYPLYYDGTPVTRARCHRLIVDNFQRAFRDIQAAGLQNEVRNYSGIFARRPIRGFGSHPSTHSWGIAIDLEAERYPLGSRERFPQTVVDIFQSAGSSTAATFWPARIPCTSSSVSGTSWQWRGVALALACSSGCVDVASPPGLRASSRRSLRKAAGASPTATARRGQHIPAPGSGATRCASRRRFARGGVVVTPAGMRHDLKLAETVTRGYTVLEPQAEWLVEKRLCRRRSQCCFTSRQITMWARKRARRRTSS